MMMMIIIIIRILSMTLIQCVNQPTSISVYPSVCVHRRTKQTHHMPQPPHDNNNDIDTDIEHLIINTCKHFHIRVGFISLAKKGEEEEANVQQQQIFILCADRLSRGFEF